MEECAKCPEVTCIQPRGAMYVMVRVEFDRLHGFTDDTDFSSKLLKEENVFVLPGQCFSMPSYFRLVTCAPPHILQQAIVRASDFCSRHRKPAFCVDGSPVKRSAELVSLTNGHSTAETSPAVSKKRRAL
ncbi:tat [Symbiodinium microadriaticum]|nr:tat [Symbiodinium microadriaticum]